MELIYTKLMIKKDKTLIDALELMDSSGYKLLIVMDDDKFHSLISIGDIQRAIISGVELESCINSHLRDNIKFARTHDNEQFIVDLMTKHRMDFCPVINSKKELERVVFWDDIKGEKPLYKKSKIDLPIVIMAGGKGTRLKPLTNIIPKPMVPFGDKSIINVIFEKFLNEGCKDFYVSGNYMFDLLKLHIESLDLPVNIDVVKELNPTGTGGSLALFKDKIKSTFIVTNCDILIYDDYSKFLKYHEDNGNEITVVSSIKTYKIPYGTLETKANGLLNNISEKPKLSYQINTGFYILEPSVFNLVPFQKFINITDVINLVKKNGGRVGVFPVSDNSWKDIGEWNLFLKESYFN